MTAAQDDRAPLLPGSTRRSWIDRRLQAGDGGRLDVNHYVMALYYRPLQVWFRRCPWSWLGSPEEIVAEFFRDRLGREGFFDGWHRRSLRLRHWILGAFKYFLLEHSRKVRSEGGAVELTEDAKVLDEPAGADLDRAFAEALVAEARRRAEALCSARGMSEHWRVLIEHVENDRPLKDIAIEIRVPLERAKRMARTARGVFKSALRDLLARDASARVDLDSEIHRLLRCLEA